MRVVSLGMLFASAVALTSFAQAADNAAGKAKAEICAGCHGDNGISQTENIPSLAGQLDQFIQWQLVFFRAGARKNEQMQPIVEQLSNEDIRNLGAYFASLPPFKGGKDDNPDLSEKGKQAAAGRRCASCHGDTFAGTKAVARIAEIRAAFGHDIEFGIDFHGRVAAVPSIRARLHACVGIGELRSRERRSCAAALAAAVTLRRRLPSVTAAAASRNSSSGVVGGSARSTGCPRLSRSRGSPQPHFSHLRSMCCSHMLRHSRSLSARERHRRLT